MGTKRGLSKEPPERTHEAWPLVDSDGNLVGARLLRADGAEFALMIEQPKPVYCLQCGLIKGKGGICPGVNSEWPG